jgi:ketosteroid isomerase-like protein
LPAKAVQNLSVAQVESDRRELQRLNDLWFEAYRTKSADTLARILADDFVGDYGTGQARTKQQMVDSLRDPKRPAMDIRSFDVAIHLFGDTAMVTGRSVTQTVRDGVPAPTANRYADIYVRRNGKWRAVAAHVVRVPPPQ